MHPETKPEMSQVPPGGKVTTTGFEDDDLRAIGDILVKLVPADARMLLDYLHATGAAKDATHLQASH